MILIIIITKKETVIEHIHIHMSIFSTIPSTKTKTHYFDSRESYVTFN